MLLLSQFVLRLSFGLAVAMAVTSPRQVASGFYRNHLYVLLGLAALAATMSFASPQLMPWPPLVAAVGSYAGAVVWLYEKPRPGIALLVLVAAAALAGAWLALAWPPVTEPALRTLAWLDPITGGLVLGVTIGAMFLGHWYLNSPSMKLQPLRRLVALMTAALLVRLVVCGVALAMMIAAEGRPPADRLLFLGFRWFAGLAGPLVLAWMAWQTLKIPNTQSATGILYVAVIGTFLGELISQLLSADTGYPL